MIEAEGVSERGQRNQTGEIGVQILLIRDSAQVAFELAVVGGVEAREGDENANVGIPSAFRP